MDVIAAPAGPSWSWRCVGVEELLCFAGAGVVAPLVGAGMGRVRGVATQPLACPQAPLRELQPPGALLRLLELWGQAFSYPGPFLYYG